MAALPQSSPHLFLDELEVDGTGTIIVMIGRVWDVNAITDRYLSTYFVVSDSKHDTFMLKFDGSTTIRKVSSNSVGFLRYPFQLVDFDRIEVTNHKYLIDVIGYVTNVRRTTYTKSGSKTLSFYLENQRVQSLRATLWDGLCDVLVERKTAHVDMCAIVLTLMSTKNYNSLDP
ncbi:replication protein A 70 kDa DNA-binding subunit C-like protein [Tanacetum coccineum]